MKPEPNPNPLRLTLEPDPEANPQSAADGPSIDAGRFEAEAAHIPDVIGPDAEPASEAAGTATPVGSTEPGWPMQIVRGIFTVPCAYLGRRLGDYWDLSPPEADILAQAWKPVLDEWLPWDSFGKMGPALVTLALAFGPRITQWQLERAQPAIPNTQTAQSAA